MKSSFRNLNSNGRISNLLTVLLIVMLLACCGRNSVKENNKSSLDKSTMNISDSIYTEVDSMPLFTGGDQALLKFIAENTVYPEEATKNNVTGRVLVKFVVHKDCTVSDVTLAKGVNPLLDSEALKVIGKLPRFERPGVLNGQAVSVYYIVPITFALK